MQLVNTVNEGPKHQKLRYLVRKQIECVSNTLAIRAGEYVCNVVIGLLHTEWNWVFSYCFL